MKQAHDLLHHVWPWEKSVCVFLCVYMCAWDSPLSGFLLEGRQTARDSGLAQLTEGEREWETERGREVYGGVVKLTVPPFSKLFLPWTPEKTSRTSKTQKNKWRPSFRWWSAADSHSQASRQSFPLSADMHWLTIEGASSEQWLTDV